MNMNSTAGLSSGNDIGARTGKLHTSAQRCSQEILAGFDFTTFLLTGGCLTTGPPDLDKSKPTL